MDNYAAHKHANVKAWLAEHPRFVVLHPDPRLVDEPGRGLVRHRRTTGHPTRSLQVRQDLNAKVRAFIEGWNDRALPFVWTKTAEQVLAKAIPKGTSNARN